MMDAANPREDNDQARTNSQRLELLHHLEAFLEPLLASLGLVFLALLLVDLSDALTTPRQRYWLDLAINLIWGIFIVDFVVRLIIAPEKRHYLRRNWVTLLSLALPFLRPVRALQALGAIRSLSLVRLLAGMNRGMRTVQSVTRGRQFAYMAALSLLVLLCGAVGVLSFERGIPESPIKNLGDALWWSAALLTTIDSEKYVVSAEARIIAVLQGIFAVSVFGFVTAAIASHFISRPSIEHGAPPVADGPPPDRVLAEIAALRHENELLRGDIAALRQAIEGDRVTG